MKERVLVAMSGGVDSSVAAAVLLEQGYDVVGVTMKLHDDGADVPDKPCCSLDATSDARRVCEQLGVPHYVLNLVDVFTRDVFDDFVSEYAAGRTPSPCVRCNTFTKFRDLVDKADAIDAQWVATGHYGRLADTAHGRALLRGRDPAKDQSYFLWGMPRPVLDRLLLPVGDWTKEETRAAARRFGLRTANKPESMDICFVPHGDHMEILREQLPADAAALSPGTVVTEDGTVLGTHDGFARFTIGQRKGLPGGFAEPLFVIEIRAHSREVVVGPRAALARNVVSANQVSWLAPAPAAGDRVQVQVRHRGASVAGTVLRSSATELEVALSEPVNAIAPGQSLVVYHDELVLGGGVIARAGRGALPVLV
jgi:tRNA-uridine 2-sulfurtransferase